MYAPPARVGVSEPVHAQFALLLTGDKAARQFFARPEAEGQPARRNQIPSSRIEVAKPSPRIGSCAGHCGPPNPRLSGLRPRPASYLRRKFGSGACTRESTPL